MGRATTRKQVKRMYASCMGCQQNISGYGKCLAGYDNYYFRKSKNNGCGKCRKDPEKK